MYTATFGANQKVMSYFEFNQTNNAEAPDVIVAGAYEGYADVWNHVFTVGVNPPQEVDYACCSPNTDLSSLGTLDIECSSMWTSNCGGDRTLVSVTSVNSQVSPDLYWLADTTTSCTYYTVINQTGGVTNMSLECRQPIGKYSITH